MLQLLDFNESPNVGVFCRANDNVGFVQKGLLKRIKKNIVETLDIKLVELSIADASIIGSLLTINSNGAVVTDFVDEGSVKIIEDQDLNVCVIEDKLNAAGNDILVNDKGVLVHPDMKDHTLKMIEKTFNIPVYKGTIGSLKTGAILHKYGGSPQASSRKYFETYRTTESNPASTYLVREFPFAPYLS